MKSAKSAAPRAYRQTARAEASQQTRRSIMLAAVALWRRKDVDQITLDEIAAEAGTTRQTVLRHFGSKEGLTDALMAEGTGVEEHRNEVDVGDIDGALDVLLEHYERDGDAVLRGLALEGRSEMASRVVAHGRKAHRAWCARVFAPHLPSPRARAYDARLDAFVAATDIYLWKLLRRDLGRTRLETRAALEILVLALAAPPTKKGRR